MTQPAATPTEPDAKMLGVHVLSEHIFCPRAGLISYEQEVEDDGRECAILRLDYQPEYEMEEIDQRLSELATLLWQLALATFVFAVLGYLLSYAIHWTFFWSGLLAAAVVAKLFVKQLPHVFKLLRDRRAASRATPDEPNPRLSRDQAVNWWSLQAAGLKPQPCSELLVDGRLRVKGQPWRILRRGDLAIPAFVRRSDNELRPQQRARIAAYCHLIRENEGAQSPYGIVLDRGSFNGTAVQPTQAELQSIRRARDQLIRNIDAAARYDLSPNPPSDLALCHGCPYGEPKLHRPGLTETTRHGEKTLVYGRTDRRKRIWHSACGDRFRWVPEHAIAQRLGLL